MGATDQHEEQLSQCWSFLLQGISPLCSPPTPLRMPDFWFFTDSWGKSSLGARLRTRKVTSRDASLPAPLLSAFEMLVARGTVGALPQTPQGTLSLDPARGRRKGTKSPLDPFSRLSWSRFHAPSACSFLVLRLSPCLLPQFSVKNLIFSAQNPPAFQKNGAPSRFAGNAAFAC